MTLQELKRTLDQASQVFVLTDENVAALWLPELKHWLGCESAVEIVIKAGEGQKTLAVAQRIWKRLLRHQADRDAVLVNLGGGMITDLGGFVASCYQRGIRFVNVPTTLLGMVDAAIGGKNGVDFGGFKNQIGTFAEPLEVLISPVYLSTLPARELLSGLAEMLKYGFIADPSMLKIDQHNFEQYLFRAGRIKREIVSNDFKDQGQRKVLNFGHTMGHALESWSLTTEHPLRHGEAVAVGMACALWISMKQCGLQQEVLQAYWLQLRMLLGTSGMKLTFADVDAVLANLVHDKKNRSGATRWVLLLAPGKPVWDQTVSDDLVRASLCEVIENLG